MENLKQHIADINKDYVSTYFAMYMEGEWGVQVGYSPVPVSIVNMRKELADWQQGSDCCALCNQSTTDKPYTITSYGTLSVHPNPLFQPLFSTGHSCFVNQSLNNTWNR